LACSGQTINIDDKNQVKMTQRVTATPQSFAEVWTLTMKLPEDDTRIGSEQLVNIVQISRAANGVAQNGTACV